MLKKKRARSSDDVSKLGTIPKKKFLAVTYNSNIMAGGSKVNNNNNNRFSPLSQLVQDAAKTTDDVKMDKPKIKKPPPINIVDQSKADIQKLLIAANISDYYIKNTSIGTQIFCNILADYNNLIEILKKNNNKFFSHDSATTKPVKFVLYGLHSVDINELIIELKAKDILNCTEVKKMNIKNQRYADQATYMLYFERGSVKQSELKEKCKVLFYTIVKWDFYRPSTKGPTRCFNCQTYGHGSKWCYLKTRCNICAGEHKSNDCPDLEKFNNADKNTVLKCANCQGNHPSSFINCPARADYLQLQAALRKKTQRARNKGNPQQNNSFFKDVNFPILPTPQNKNSMRSISSNIKNNTQNYTNFNNDFPISFANVTKNINIPDENMSNMFSASELLTLFNELLINLKKCRSKQDQINVVAHLAIKHIYGN